MVYRQIRGRKIDVNFAIARGRARAGSWLWMSQGLLGLPVPGAPPSPLLQAGWMGALAATGLGASCPAWRPWCCSRGLEEQGLPSLWRDTWWDALLLKGTMRAEFLIPAWFGHAVTGGLLSLSAGKTSAAFTTIKVASKHHSPAQCKITANTLQ